ncbi:TetR/AcrR family transcriptional regulator [Oceanobacillus sp. CAU 1775]
MVKGKDTKNVIHKAAVKVIAQQGINNFSINKVAEVAKISKGGFLYHFPSKDALLESLQQYIVDFASEIIIAEKEKRDSYTEAFIYGCYKVSKSEEVKAYTSLLNYGASNRVDEMWSDFYNRVFSKLSTELSPAWISLLSIVADGVWIKGAYHKNEEIESALELLVELAGKVE